MKNRYGEADVEVGCGFYGKCGLWKELPKSNEIYDYDKYLTTNYLLEKDSKKEVADIAKQEDNLETKIKFNFKL